MNIYDICIAQPHISAIFASAAPAFVLLLAPTVPASELLHLLYHPSSGLVMAGPLKFPRQQECMDMLIKINQ